MNDSAHQPKQRIYTYEAVNNSKRAKKASHVFGEEKELTCEEPSDLTNHFVKLEKLLVEDIRLWWDITTLENYINTNRIPRGLRVKKVPTFGFANRQFEQDWIKILDKCSVRLMELIIQQKIHEKDVLNVEITAFQNKLKPFETRDQFIKNDVTLLENLEIIEEGISEKKQIKYERDKADYSRGHIYCWQKPPQREGSRSRTPKKYFEKGRDNRVPNKSILKSKRVDTSSFDSDHSENETRSHSVSFDRSDDYGREHNDTRRSDPKPSTSTAFMFSRPLKSDSKLVSNSISKNSVEHEDQRGNGETRGRTKRKKYT
ncbi:uncharacterized protein LOC142495857 [Ascaphus truei]|uniref:uncharacterized protein LOC142495857 n=1 Tax=Ascaphus truei TaxID=8439 RepID=UPI003F59FF99